MGRILLAFRAFFGILFSRLTADKVRTALLPAPGQGSIPAAGTPGTGTTTTVAASTKTAAQAKIASKPPTRSDALTLLAALQREARFVDFLMEPLAGFADAQIGAVARDVHRDCGKVIERMFQVQAVRGEGEGSPLEVPAGFDGGVFRLIGNVAGSPPYNGKLVHHGWKAGRCEVASWTGSAEAAQIIAPVEVEI